MYAACCMECITRGASSAKHMRINRRTAAQRSRQAPPLLTHDGTPESSSKDASADAVDSPNLWKIIAQLDVEQQQLQMQQMSTCVWHDVAMQAWWRRSWRLGRPNGSCRCRGCPGFCPWRRPWPALCWTCSACVAPELHVDVRRAPNAAVAPSGRRGPAAAAAKAVRTCSGRPSDREAGRRHLWVPRAL